MKPHLFLDSGAYTALTKGVKIDIGAFADFIKRDLRHFEVYASLDDLTDPEQTHRNQRELERRGLKPLPTFHSGEHIKYLKDMVMEYDYIALGGAVGQGTSALVRWLDEIWSHIVDADGRPVCKVHGFGITSRKVMTRYPWYSVDSTAPVMQGAVGNVDFYDEQSHAIYYVPMTPTAPGHDRDGGHFLTLRPAQQEYILNMAAKYGLTYEALISDYKVRTLFNCHSFMNFAKRTPFREFLPPSDGLFGRSWTPKKKPVTPWKHLTMYVAGTPGDTGFAETLINNGVNRLLSYWYVKDESAYYRKTKEARDAFEAK